MAKLIFGGIILTGIIDMDFNKPLLFLTGSVVVLKPNFIILKDYTYVKSTINFY